MKKITTLLLMLTITFSQAQLFTLVRTNGGTDHHTANRTVTDWLHYDNGTNSQAFGSDNSHTIGAYIKLKQSLLATHVNRKIEQVKFFLSQKASNISGNVTVEIYTDPSANPTYTENFPMSGLTAGDWNTVTLTTPFIITGDEIYVGYKFTAAGRIVGVDNGSGFTANVNFYKVDGSDMKPLDAIGSVNLNIQVGVGGARAEKDASISNIEIENAIEVGSVDVKATIINYGSNTLNSIDFNYKVDNGTVQTDNLTGLNLATGQSTTVTHSVPWNATSGQHTLDVSVSNFNGNGADDVPGNDHRVKNIMVLNEIFPRTVVYEEGTGTWCGWCVRGIVGLKDMTHYYSDDFIGIAVHNGDPMEVTEYHNNLGITSFPNGKFNRQSEPIDPNYNDLEANYQIEKQKIPVAKIEITNKTWDAGTRELTAEVTTTFGLDLDNADYNASLIIVEDGVTGTASGYAQHNYYSGQYSLTDWEGTDYKDLPDPIPASDMVYDHVGRAIVGGWNGVAGSIPASVTYNTPYTYTFTYTLPASINADHVKLVGLILNNANGQIVNGVESKLTAVSVNELFNDYQVEIYPNPSTGIFNISGAKDMDITVFDILGHQIAKQTISKEFTQLSLNNLPKGLYFVRFNKDDKSGVKKIVIK